MSKILLNPTNGSLIKNVQIQGKKYFAEKPFGVDSMIKLEDDSVADDLLKLFEFLVFLTPEDAKKYKDDQAKRTHVCEKCDAKLTTKQALDAHVAKHIEDEKLEKELGIEVIAVEEKKEKVVVNPQDIITQDARLQGLDYGEGLRNL